MVSIFYTRSDKDFLIGGGIFFEGQKIVQYCLFIKYLLLFNQDEVIHSQDYQSQEEEEETKDSELDFDYLLGMTMWTLTKEKKDELLRKKDEKLAELRALEAKKPGDLWRDDLDTFLIAVSICNYFDIQQFQNSMQYTT